MCLDRKERKRAACVELSRRHGIEMFLVSVEYDVDRVVWYAVDETELGHMSHFDPIIYAVFFDGELTDEHPQGFPAFDRV